MTVKRRRTAIWGGLTVLVVAAAFASCSRDRGGTAEPAGPCLDARYEVIGSETLTVRTSDTEADAAFGWMRVANCPGVTLNGGPLEADGFLLTLDESLVSVLPGQEFHVLGPGFQSAHMTTEWVVDPAGIASDDGTVWTLVAPQEPGRYEIDIGLRWDQGEAAYAALVEVFSP